MTTTQSQSSPKSVLLIGFDPKFIPYNAPEYIHEGWEAEATSPGVYRIEQDLLDAGYAARSQLVDQGDTAIQVATEALNSRQWDIVCIGAGVRKGPRPAFILFEKMVNLIKNLAPNAKICFNESPESTVAAVKRWDV